MTDRAKDSDAILEAEAYLIATRRARQAPSGGRDFAWEALLVDAIILGVKYILERCGEVSPARVRAKAAELIDPPWWALPSRLQRSRLRAEVRDAFEVASAWRRGMHSEDDVEWALVQILSRATTADDRTLAACMRAAR